MIFGMDSANGESYGIRVISPSRLSESSLRVVSPCRLSESSLRLVSLLSLCEWRLLSFFHASPCSLITCLHHLSTFLTYISYIPWNINNTNIPKKNKEMFFAMEYHPYNPPFPLISSYTYLTRKDDSERRLGE